MGPSSSMRTPGAGSLRPRADRARRTRARRAPRSWPHLELGEDDGELGVGRGVADVVLVGLGPVRGDHELARLGVVRRDRAERLHVGAVAGLGHREAAHHLPGDQVGEVLLVVPRGPELEDRPAEQPELDADLDQHRQVAEGQRLEGRERRPDVTPAAVLLREAHAGLAGGRHLEDDLLDPLPERRPVERLGLLEDRRRTRPGWCAPAAAPRRTGRRAARSARGRRPSAGRSRPPRARGASASLLRRVLVRLLVRGWVSSPWPRRRLPRSDERLPARARHLDKLMSEGRSEPTSPPAGRACRDRGASAYGRSAPSAGRGASRQAR